MLQLQNPCFPEFYPFKRKSGSVLETVARLNHSDIIFAVTNDYNFD